VRGSHTPVFDPQFDPMSDGLLLTWRATTERGGQETAWSVRLGATGIPLSPIRRMANEASLVYHATRGDRGVWVMTNTRRPFDHVQLIEHDKSATPIAKSETTTEYGGVLGASIGGGFLVVVASQRGASPDDPAVISLIRSYPWRCP